MRVHPYCKAVDELVSDCLELADVIIDRYKFTGRQKQAIRRAVYSRVRRLDLVGMRARARGQE